MKTLLILLTITMSAAYAGPRVTGNGGGGIKKNGVYKTFYSSGAYINPEEVTEIPGADIYRSTILSLAGKGESTSQLFAAALPMGDRKFYNILEDRMDDATMKRLIEEYARVVSQPADDLTIFAITDIATKTTYLLPNFYKLSENEQATILFHEAYWILNPKADYAKVVNAEMIFQEFLELKESGKYNHKLPRLLGTLLSDPTLALQSAVKEDMRTNRSPEILDAKGNVSLTNVFTNFSKMCSFYKDSQTFTEKKFLAKSTKTVSKGSLGCELSYEDLQETLAFQQKHPESYFLQELVSYLSMKNKISYRSIEITKEGENVEANYKEIERSLKALKTNVSNARSTVNKDTDWNGNVRSAKAEVYLREAK